MRRPCLCSATPYLLPNAVRLQHVNYGQTDSIKVCLPRSGFVQQVQPVGGRKGQSDLTDPSDVNALIPITIAPPDSQADSHYFTILVKSHMGRKMARAKKTTTTVSETIRMGPMASDSPLVAYSTSSS